MGVRGDYQLYTMAINRRWSIPAELKHRIVESIAIDIESDDSRIRSAARKCAIAIEKQNQADDHKLLDVAVQTRDDQLLAIASDLGIDPALITDAAESGDSGVEEFENGEPENTAD